MLSLSRNRCWQDLPTENGEYNGGHTHIHELRNISYIGISIRLVPIFFIAKKLEYMEAYL